MSFCVSVISCQHFSFKCPQPGQWHWFKYLNPSSQPCRIFNPSTESAREEDMHRNSNVVVLVIFYLTTFISNMGGTQGGRARLSVTLLCLWAVWPEENVNLFTSSCLRKNKNFDKQNYVKPKIFPNVNFSFGCLDFNLKFGHLLKWEALSSQTRNWIIQLKALNTFVKISSFNFHLNLNLWLTLASTFLTLPQSTCA